MSSHFYTQNIAPNLPSYIFYVNKLFLLYQFICTKLYDTWPKTPNFPSYASSCMLYQCDHTEVLTGKNLLLVRVAWSIHFNLYSINNDMDHQRKRKHYCKYMHVINTWKILWGHLKLKKFPQRERSYKVKQLTTCRKWVWSHSCLLADDWHLHIHYWNTFST